MNGKIYAGLLWIVISMIISLFFLILSFSVYSGIIKAEELNRIVKIKYGDRMIGGDVLYIITNEDYVMHIHKEVYDGILPEGFVQVMFYPVKEKLPLEIIENIDYNNDGIKDFKIKYDTEKIKADIEIYNKKVLGLDESWMIFFKKSRGFRVRLQKNQYNFKK